MDSQRKHELESNDLKDFLENFKDFWDRNGNFILIILILAIGGWAVMRFIGNHKTEAKNDAHAALASADGPDELMTVAADYDLVHDQAMLHAGDLYLERSMQRMGRNETEKANTDLDSAEHAYQGLIDSTDKKPYITNAYLGLATVAMGRHDWDAAAAALASAKEAAGDLYPALTANAQRSEETLAQLRNLVPFAPLPAPLEMPDFGVDDNGNAGDGGDETPAEFVPGPFGFPGLGDPDPENGDPSGIENLLPSDTEPGLPVPDLGDPQTPAEDE